MTATNTSPIRDLRMQEGLGHENNFNLIRLLAAFQVFLVHAAHHFGFEGASVSLLKLIPGVPVFFFVSGYLIHGAYERTRGGSAMVFFVNRALRIYPAMLICFIVSVLLVYLSGYFAAHPPTLAGSLVWLISQTTVLQIYHPAFMREFGTGVLNAPLWTVFVELQFYVLAPVLSLVFQRSKWAAAAMFGVSLAVNLGLRQYLDWDAASMIVKVLYVSFLPWVYMFMFGALLAAHAGLRQRALELRGWYLALLYVASMTFIGSFHSNASSSIHAIGFFLLAVGILKMGQAKLPLLPDWLTRLVGRNDFSYGLYLYHMPIINLLLYLGLYTAVQNTCIAAAGSLVLAVASWYFVEKPTLRFKRLATRSP